MSTQPGDVYVSWRDQMDATATLQAAIDACAAGHGGRVVVAAGGYRCGTLHLRSGVELHLSADAVLRQAEGEAAFPVVDQAHYNPKQLRAMIMADRCRDVAITGRGAIVGAGEEPTTWQQANALGCRPTLVYMRDCRHVRLSGFTLRHATFWTIHLLRCDGVHAEDLVIANGWPNSDGIDIDGCRNVHVRRCRIAAGDDCVCLKSTQGDECRDILIEDCSLQTTCAALKLGTEGIGPIRDVEMRRCRITDSATGIALYVKDGGDYERITFTDLHIESPGQFPIVLDVTKRYFDEPVPVGAIRQVTLRNIQLLSPGRIHVEGAADRPIRDLAIHNLDWQVTGPVRTTDIAKPIGGARGRRDPHQPNHAIHPCRLLAAHVEGLTVERLTLHPQAGADSPENSRWLHLHQAGRVSVTDCHPPVSCPRA